MPKPLFKKILIANRGEIACRVIQTVQEMGIQAAALYSDADALANHVRMADESFHLPGNKPGETYLDFKKILEIAKANGVDAIHPGYGFLSENPEFAKGCAAAGIKFIGPTPEVIHSMGDKMIAKETMIKAGVPVVPGFTWDVKNPPPGWAGDMKADFKIIEAEAKKVGYPLLVKAAAGGGGKGMRLVEKAEDLKNALEAAGREAQNAFGDARVFLEKYIANPRHIEFQIFGDSHGNAVHLFERECSIQRRYQKIIEESPGPGMTPALREKMGEAAVKAAQAIGYQNAGTVEFIVPSGDNPNLDFYFLEVNTRLQVEHPVTEMVTHLDLVRLQIQIAAGEKLPFQQADLKQDGHAIECRIYAEDPNNNFMPSVGPLAVYRPPNGANIRVDNGYSQGYEVTVHYDPMLAKLIVWGKTRQDALDKMRWALSNYVILGFNHNVEFLRQIIEHPEFQAGHIHTHFLTKNPIQSKLDNTPDEVMLIGALAKVGGKSMAMQDSSTTPQDTSPWQQLGAWRGGGVN